MNTRFDTEARVAVTQAADLARELGHREVGPDHLLLGLLANPRGAAYALLWDHGLHLDTAREIVVDHHVDPAEPSADTTEPGRQPATSAYDDDREALRAIGIDLDRVRDAVRANLGQDLADGWGDRPGPRGAGRGPRGSGRRGGPHHHHQQERGRGRRGPRSRRPDSPRFSRSLRALLRDVRRSVLSDRSDGQAEVATAMSGTRLLAALLRSDDPAVQAVLATADDLAVLRADAEAAIRPAPEVG